MGLLFSFKSKALLMASARNAKKNNGFPNVHPEEFSAWVEHSICGSMVEVILLQCEGCVVWLSTPLPLPTGSGGNSSLEERSGIIRFAVLHCFLQASAYVMLHAVLMFIILKLLREFSHDLVITRTVKDVQLADTGAWKTNIVAQWCPLGVINATILDILGECATCTWVLSNEMKPKVCLIKVT